MMKLIPGQTESGISRCKHIEAGSDMSDVSLSARRLTSVSSKTSRLPRSYESCSWCYKGEIGKQDNTQLAHRASNSLIESESSKPKIRQFQNGTFTVSTGVLEVSVIPQLNNTL